MVAKDLYYDPIAKLVDDFKKGDWDPTKWDAAKWGKRPVGRQRRSGPGGLGHRADSRPGFR